MIRAHSVRVTEIRVYGQFCIKTLHESRKRKSSGSFVRISTFMYIYILVIKVSITMLDFHT